MIGPLHAVLMVSCAPGAGNASRFALILRHQGASSGKLLRDLPGVKRGLGIAPELNRCRTTADREASRRPQPLPPCSCVSSIPGLPTQHRYPRFQRIVSICRENVVVPLIRVNLFRRWSVTGRISPIASETPFWRHGSRHQPDGFRRRFISISASSSSRPLPQILSSVSVCFALNGCSFSSRCRIESTNPCFPLGRSSSRFAVLNHRQYSSTHVAIIASASLPPTRRDRPQTAGP